MCNAYNSMASQQYDESKLNTVIDSKAKDPYPWLAPGDIRRSMSDREILEKYINLDDSCLNKTGKRKLLDMLHNYKEAFSLRDEIGTSVGITVDFDLVDKTPFL